MRQAYYVGLPNPSTDFLLSIAGWGWHSETAIHILRLVLNGTLDKHPKLKLIIGHMGEMLPMMLARCDEILGRETRDYLQRSVSQTIIDQVHVTTSGLFTVPPLQVLLAVFGIDNVMFSVDYPFSANSKGRAFLDQLPLAPADVAKLAHGNADPCSNCAREQNLRAGAAVPVWRSTLGRDAVQSAWLFRPAAVFQLPWRWKRG